MALFLLLKLTALGLFDNIFFELPFAFGNSQISLTQNMPQRDMLISIASEPVSSKDKNLKYVVSLWSTTMAVVTRGVLEFVHLYQEQGSTISVTERNIFFAERSVC